MGSGAAAHIRRLAAVVVLAAATTADACLWCVSIDESPAPPPEDVPPFSAHAIRDRDLLPYQIIGVVGAYVGTVLVVGSLLLTVGRNMRNRAQSMANRPVEMSKPIHKAFDPSPVSPTSNRGWYPLRNKKSASSSFMSSNDKSPAIESVISFDNHVLEADKVKMQTEMERLYAAVMDQDQTKIRPNVTETALPPPPPPPPDYASGFPAAPFNPAVRRLQDSNEYSQPLRSPMRAIYPPTAQVAESPFSPATSIDSEPQNWPHSPVARVASPLSGRNIKIASPVSAKPRKGLRNLTISPPILRQIDDNEDGARTPLSPRTYGDPGIPPEPPTARSMAPPPETPATERMFPLYAEEDEDLEEEHQRSQNLRLSSEGKKPLPIPHTPRLVTNFNKPVPSSNATSTGTLPFREMNRQYPARSQTAASVAPGGALTQYPLSPSAYLTSAGPVKTTFVEARRDRFMGGLRTGMATPYSPYMPFTPITPITPHLTSRAERRQKAREENTIRGAITEEDAVAEDGDMWGSGY